MNITQLGVAIATLVAILRAIGGWRSWAQIIQMAVILALLGFLLGVQESLLEGLGKALIVSIVGTFFFWQMGGSLNMSREGEREDKEDRDRSFRRIGSTILVVLLLEWIAAMVLFVGAFGDNLWMIPAAAFVVTLLVFFMLRRRQSQR
jgi:hypothetical protein